MNDCTVKTVYYKTCTKQKTAQGRNFFRSCEFTTNIGKNPSGINGNHKVQRETENKQKTLMENILDINFFPQNCTNEFSFLLVVYFQSDCTFHFYCSVAGTSALRAAN